MQISYKQFDKLNFPLFVLDSDNYYSQDKILYLDNQVLDDKNMPGKTLGLRRLQCQRHDLLPLKRCLFKPIELIKSKFKYYIDNKGNFITYIREYNSKLITYKILRIDKKDTASLLWLKGVNTPFTLDRPPITDFSYVRVLHFGTSPWLIYDYVRQLEKPTYRRV